MTENIYLLTICLPLATVVLIFAMRSATAVLQARAKTKGEAASLEVIESLNEIKARLAGIEKILKEVE